MLKTLSKLNTCVYYWNSVENTPNNYGKRFPPLLRVFPATPTVVNNSVGNGFYDAFPGNSSTQNELKIKKRTIVAKILFPNEFFGSFKIPKNISSFPLPLMPRRLETFL